MIEFKMPGVFTDPDLPYAPPSIGRPWQYWWGADSIIEPDGTPIGVWRDLSDERAAFTAPQEDWRPTVQTLSNGRRVLEFDSTIGHRMSTDELGVACGTIFVVARAMPDGPLPAPFVAFGNPQVPGESQVDGRIQQGITGQVVIDPLGTDDFGTSPAHDAGEWLVVVHSNAASTGPLAFVNGDLVSIDTTVSYRGIRKIFLANNGSARLTGQVATVGMCFGHLSQPALNDACSRLMADWGDSG